MEYRLGKYQNINQETRWATIDEIKSSGSYVDLKADVYPAAGLLRYFRGKNLVLINRNETNMDYMATLVIHDKVGEVLDKIKL